MITIKEVKTKKELKRFVKFPFTLYKDSKYWTPPIISQEIKTFDKIPDNLCNELRRLYRIFHFIDAEYTDVITYTRISCDGADFPARETIGREIV